jgi:DNA-binding NarL/FixJ family response regulator
MTHSPVRESPVKVMIVDDHPIVREGLTKLIEGEDDFSVCASAEDINSAMNLLERLVPDLLILDLTFPVGNGIDLIKHIRKDNARMAILVLSMHDSLFQVEQALRAGANGYVTKVEAPKTLIQAIRGVLAGNIYVNEKAAAALLKRSVGKTRERGGDDVFSLSDREREVFGLLGKGLGTRQIAEKLFVSIRTVDTHRENIKHKLNLKNASELLQCAIEWNKGQKG